MRRSFVLLVLASAGIYSCDEELSPPTVQREAEKPAEAPPPAEPQSALVALARVVQLLEDTEKVYAGDGYMGFHPDVGPLKIESRAVARGGTSADSVDLRGVGARFEYGRRGRPDHVRVVLDLDFHASNTLQGAKIYEGFLTLARESDVVSDVGQASSKALADGKGIRVDDLSLWLDLSRASLPKARESRASELGAHVFVRSVASERSAGEVDISVSEKAVTEDQVDHDYRVQPSDAERGLGADALFAFLYALDSDPAVVVTRIEVKRREEAGPDEPWSWECTLTERRRE